MSDVVGDALRLLKQADNARMDAQARSRQAWDEGLSSGDAGEIDIETLKADAQATLKRAG